MPNYRRLIVPGGEFFFTVNLLERRQSLLTEDIASVVRWPLRWRMAANKGAPARRPAFEQSQPFFTPAVT